MASLAAHTITEKIGPSQFRTKRQEVHQNSSIPYPWDRPEHLGHHFPDHPRQEGGHRISHIGLPSRGASCRGRRMSDLHCWENVPLRAHSGTCVFGDRGMAAPRLPLLVDRIHRLLRRRKTFSMWNIVGITESPGMTVIHLQGKKKIRIDAARGAGQLVDAIEVHYRTVQKKGFALPDIPEKLFNGYLANPRDFLLAFGFVLFVEFSLVTGACVFLLKGVNMPDETFELAVNEFHTTIDDDMLYIQSPESQKQFVCPSFQRVLREKGQTAEDFLTEMAQQSVVTITGDEKRLQRTQTVFLTIYGLTGNDGKTILQYEDIKAGLLQNLLPWFYTAGGIVLYTVLFIAFICYVVAHAPRFPRLVRLLIKEEWLNI